MFTVKTAVKTGLHPTPPCSDAAGDRAAPAPRPPAGRRAMLGLLGLGALLAGTGLPGCASGPVAAVGVAPPAAAWPRADAAFGPPPALPSEASLWALDEPMQRFLQQRLLPGLRLASGWHAPASRLLEALYQSRELQLEYDDRSTRTASEAFAARRGNCLSLVLMTTAFARAMGLQVQFNEALVDRPWVADRGFVLRTGHVNLTLVGTASTASAGSAMRPMTLVDFLPGVDLQRLRLRPIGEPRVVAMFYNNRAAEALVAGDLAPAYWLAQAALAQDPAFLAAANTLAVVMLRGGQVEAASLALERVLAAQPEDTSALANLASVRLQQGRTAEAAQLTERLARLERDPPPGAAAEQAHAAAAASETEARRHLGQALESLARGDHPGAQAQLEAAIAAAPAEQRPRYQGKLAHLRALSAARPAPGPAIH